MNEDRHGTAKVALPGCTPLESLILPQLVAWYTEFSDRASTGASYKPPPTTKRATEYLRVSHRDALAIMSRLEMRGLPPMQPKSKRRVHGAEFKTQVLAECQLPGASVAAIALAHGLNVNLLRKWLVGRGIQRTGLAAPRARRGPECTVH